MLSQHIASCRFDEADDTQDMILDCLKIRSTPWDDLLVDLQDASDVQLPDNATSSEDGWS